MMKCSLSTLIWVCTFVQTCWCKKLDSFNFCTECQCDFVNSQSICQDLDLIQIEKVPESLTSVQIRNVKDVVFERGTFQAKKFRFRIQILESESVTIQSESIALQHQHSNVSLSVENAGRVEIQPRAVIGRGGKFHANISTFQHMTVNAKAFDVLSTLIISNGKILNLSPNSLKPNQPSSVPDLRITLSNITSLPKIPSSSFSSAEKIHILSSNIREIESNAFSGIQFTEIKVTGCSIDRIRPKSFPQFTLINSLSFHSCQITSLSEFAVQSAMSKLVISHSEIASWSRRSLDCQAAEVRITHNNIQTLVYQSFHVGTWNDFRLVGNDIKFVDSGAFSGFHDPVDLSVTFNISRNIISYANMDAFKVDLAAGTVLIVEQNVFNKQCDCDIQAWLQILAGGPSSLLGQKLKNSSICSIPGYLQDCFYRQPLVQVEMFVEKVCTKDMQNSEKDICATSPIWNLVQDQIQIHTNKGILMTILLVAIGMSLVVSICTLMRWIVYTIQIRSKVKNAEEWNFTKIEQKSFINSPETETDHYEKLPLTSGEESEKTREQDEESLKSKTNDEDTQASRRESFVLPLNNSSNATFYDEMIDLLKEKLDDPDNYATVADTKATVNIELYENPFDKQEKND